MRYLHFLTATLAVAGLAGGPLESDSADEVRGVEPEEVALALIIHPENPNSDLDLSEIRRIFMVERQFWPKKGGRVALFLPSPSRQKIETRIILEKIYHLRDYKKLRKSWQRKRFAGDIPVLPSWVKTAKAAVQVVKRSETAISAVLASEVPHGVKVVTVSGKKPTDKGYPLAVKLEDLKKSIP